MMDRAPDRQSGFTLLEILVVVVVLGFLVVGLAQGVRAGMALWHAQQLRVGETAELDASARVLRTLLTGAAAATPGGFGPGAAAGGQIKGDANHLTFVGDLPTGLGTTRRADISIELRDGRLVLRWTPHLHEIPFGPPPQPTVTELISGVQPTPIEDDSTDPLAAAWPEGGRPGSRTAETRATMTVMRTAGPIIQ